MPKLNTPRVVEALVIAAATAGATAFMGLYVALPVLKAEIGALHVEVKRVEQRIEQLNAEHVRERVHDHEAQSSLRERVSGLEALIRRR